MGDKFVAGQMKFMGYADDVKNYNPSSSDVFYITFDVPWAEDIDWTTAEVDAADGRKYVEYVVDWENLKLVNSGVDNGKKVTEEPYNLNLKDDQKIAGSIKVYEPADYEETVTYEYKLDGNDLFCFSHDPRQFYEVFSNGKLIRTTKNKTTGKETVRTLSLRQVKDFKVETVNGGFTSPSAAFNGLGEEKIAYTDIALKVSFTDGDNAIVLDASNGFNAKAYIGVKGDANLDGICNANDATEILKYAANVGAGLQKEKPLCYETGAEWTASQRALAMFLGDVDGEVEVNTEETPQVLNANDATAVLRFAANAGTVPEMNDKTRAEIWTKILDPLPKYSTDIAAALNK